MKTIFTKMLLALCVITLFCNCTLMGGSVSPSKTTITRSYKIGNFNAIDFSGIGDINFTQSNNVTLSITGPENYVKVIDVKVDDNTLYISMDESKRFKNVRDLKINISAPTLNNITEKGVGNVIIEKPFRVSNLDIVNKGVGNIKISNISGNSVTVVLNGVGSVDIAGKVNSTVLSCHGVGNIDASDLVAKNVEANCHGVGSISCNATDSIDAVVKGVGSIKYRGNPTQKNLNRAGLGSIKHSDN